MAYSPSIQPPPQIPEDPDLYLWVKRLHETLSEYMVKDRILGRGIAYDVADRPQVTYTHIFLHGGAI